MKKTITLNILKQDILEVDYLEYEDCPIHRAINRLKNPSLTYCVGELDINDKKVNIMRLEDKVLSMYSYLKPGGRGSIPPEEPKDFEYIVEYEED